MLYIAEQEIPIGTWQYDSWWYYKDVNQGVKNWTAIESDFPEGLESVFQATSLPVVAQNGWWSSRNDYSLANGGNYLFETDFGQGAALPLEDRFWNDLFRNSTKWGLSMYEQDWLYVQTDKMHVLGKNVTMARDWLMSMGRAAESHNVNIMLVLIINIIIILIIYY